MTERNTTPTTTTTTTMNNRMIETALRLSPRFANEDSELLFDHLVAEFPTARLDVVTLIVTRACALARQGHDRLDRKMFLESLLAEIEGLAEFKSGQEITFNGGTWGMIEEVVGKTIWVTDEDGGDHELTAARID